MKLDPGAFLPLVEALKSRAELGLKRDIQLAAKSFARSQQSAWFPSKTPILNGDDTAALPDPAGGFVLFAAEGMRGELIEADPWFAGFSSLMVNINDVAAMGGRPWAVVDVLFLGGGDNARVLEGMRAASEMFGVPVVGGHTTRVSGASMLAVSVVGRASELISSHAAKPGQNLVVAVDLRGSFRGAGGNFNAATTASPAQLRSSLAVLPELAEASLVRAGKDISMAGVCGSLLMLLETSGVGAELWLERLPAPPQVDPLRWLGAFPSFGFVLAVDDDALPSVLARFDRAGVASAAAGRITSTRRLELGYEGERALYWDLQQTPLTGFGP